MKEIRIGIIGMGRMGITHYSIINSLEEVNIVAIADTSQLVLSVLKKYIKNLQVFKRYDDMLKSVELDALLVCTPPHLNYDILTKAAERKLHVFVEKPYALNFNEGKELQEVFNQSGLVNQVGYVNRFNDVFRKAKELINAGFLGEIYRYRSEMFSCTIAQPDDGSGWRASRETGGGVVYEMAAHAIDLVNFFFGKPTEVRGSQLNQVFSKSIEDAVSSTFLNDNNLTGSIYVNWCDHSYRKPTNRIEVTGKNGKLLADQHSLKIFLKNPDSAPGYRQGWNTINITDIFKPVDYYVRGNEFTSQLYHFVNCIKGKEESDCNFEDGTNVLEIIESIFKDSGKN